MRRQIAILAGAMALLVLGIAVWFGTMPYPISRWWDARCRVRYSQEWPISRSDFAVAMGLVKQKLELREIIDNVVVTGPEEIEITTLCEWSNNSLSGSGRRFIVKRTNGQWEIAARKYFLRS